jgi:Glycosyl hydrolase-like 10
MKPLLPLAVSALLLAHAAPRYAAAPPRAKIKINMVSFGDDIENKNWMPGYSHHERRYHTKESIETSLAKLKEKGASAIYWRLMWDGAPDDEIEKYSFRVQVEKDELRRQFVNTPYAWDPHELRWPVAVAHKLGMKIYAWIVPYNMGAPPGAYTELGIKPGLVHYPAVTITETQFPWMYSYLRKNPQYQLVDRTGKRYHYGVLEWGYPEARRYWTNIVQDIVGRYDVDGVYIDTRTECMAPDFADQFGFNDPVVDEYKRRYSVDIRTEDFDLEKWRALRGEYFTQLLRECSALIHAKGKLLSLGTARGDYVGFPLGNMRLEWKKWISERIIDELHLDEQGWAWGRHGYGYLTDPVTGRGLRPIDEMIRTDYGPLAKQHGVKLYFKPGLYPNQNDAWKERVAAMPEFDGVIERPNYK